MGSLGDAPRCKKKRRSSTHCYVETVQKVQEVCRNSIQMGQRVKKKKEVVLFA